MDEYFKQWFSALEHKASPGWRRCQEQFDRAYIRPIFGEKKIKYVTPILIAKVLNEVAGLGKSEQTQPYSRKDSWVKKEPVFKDHPKGMRHHSHRIPPKLHQRLWYAKPIAKSDFVATASFNNEMLSYKYYLETLKRYCKELGISEIGTHGLRHSTSELYIHHGATKEDFMRLFAHSSMAITQRYLHRKNSSLEKVANPKLGIALQK